MQKEMLKIIDSVDKSLDRDLIIRYLISNLSVFFRRDLNFFLRSEEQQILMVQKGIEYKDDGNVICKTLAEFYIDLFKHFNINAFLVRATDKVIPLYGIIIQGTYSYYFLDPLQDLMSSQYGLTNDIYGVAPKYNGCIVIEQYPYIRDLSPNYIRYLDDRIKRFPNGVRTEDFLTMLRNELLKRNTTKTFFGIDKWDSFEVANHKMQFISDECINIGQVNGLAERHRMYHYIFKMLFEKAERSMMKVHIYREYDRDGNPINPELNICICDSQTDRCASYVETKKNGIYSLSRKP